MSWTDWLTSSADALRATSRLRRTRVIGPQAIDFSSNDYLGLSRAPEVIAAAHLALESAGNGPRGSPLVCGYTELHEQLEHALAALERTEAALLFPTGFAANLGALSALSAADTTVFSDALNHASIVDGCRLARRNGAQVVIYDHLDVDQLDARLQADTADRRLIVTDSVFSMDGDIAPLPELVEVAERHGAWLMVDEAHATLVHGADGGGIAAAQGVSERVQVHVGTLSKAFGAHGGFVACSAQVRELLLNRARAYIYSTALPAPVVASAHAALQVAADGTHRARLFEHLATVNRALGTHHPGPIIPVVLGTEARAIAAASRLEECGIFAPAIRPPTVPAGTSRIRIALSAAHTEDQIVRLVEGLRTIEA